MGTTGMTWNWPNCSRSTARGLGDCFGYGAILLSRYDADQRPRPTFALGAKNSLTGWLKK